MPSFIASVASARALAGQAVWSASALAVPALAVWHERHVAQAIVLYTLETVLGVAILRGRLARALRTRPFDDPEAARLRRARAATGTAAAFSLGLGALVFVFDLAFDVRPADLFDLGNWRGGQFDGFSGRVQWMAAGLVLGALLESWLAPARTTEWLEASAAWQLRRVAAPAFAYLPGVALTVWSGTSAGFLWPWFAMRAFTDVTALLPGARERTRQEVLREPSTSV